MKKDDSYKEDEDFESNYYRANKIKVKKVIVQGQSSKFYDRWKGFRKSTPSGGHFLIENEL